ncbi:SDR family NAD(P)-dependent oxidoreductase [Phycisphaeraceae bacterium D3-23]
MQNILVTGGAGYIGSHCVKRLVTDGHHVTVLDNLDRGHREAVEAAGGGKATLEVVDLRDTDAVEAVLKKHSIEAVIHFAALAYVGESVNEPLRYYDNNTAGSVSLLAAMGRAGVNRIVFSSTCATYGEPTQDQMPISETLPQNPINPYGWSKLMTERALMDNATANAGFGFAALRYFNVAGSDPTGTIGEDHTPETHIIPVVLNCARWARSRRSTSSAATTTRPTARASATTSTSRTWSMRTSRCSPHSGMATSGSTTSGRARARR